MSLCFRLAVKPGMVAVSVAEKFRQVIFLQISTYHADPAGVIGGMISDLGFLRYHVEFEPAAVGGGYYALGAENCSEVVVHAEQLEYVFDLCAAESAYSLDAPAVEYLIRMMMTVVVMTAAAVFIMVVVMVLVMFMVMIVVVMTAAAVLVMVVVMMFVMLMVVFMHRQRLVFQRTSDGVA